MAAPAIPAAAQEASVQPSDDLVVGLVTMGQGELVYELFGHNAIWIHDRAAGTSRVYNYGVFDFQSPGYWSRFLKGTWLYQLAVDDFAVMLDTYRYLDRTVQVQILALTSEQKRALRDFLEWNALPQNREYLYDYFRDNCSTRVRDVLDTVLGGALGAATRGVPTGTTYRSHSERLIADSLLGYSGILIGLGPAADREIDAWEEMFIPFKVQEQVRRIQVVDDSGRTVPLVAREETLYTTQKRPPQLAAPPQRTLWYLLAGIALGGSVLALGRAARRSRAARGALALAGGLWGLLIGVCGLLLLGLWTLTNHAIAYRNLSLLQMNPLALGLIVLVPALVLGGRWAVWPARLLANGLAGLSVLGLALWVLPMFVQQNAPVIAFALPGHLAMAFVVSRLEKTPR